jgi:hypothetical protein
VIGAFAYLRINLAAMRGAAFALGAAQAIGAAAQGLTPRGAWPMSPP